VQKTLKISNLKSKETHKNEIHT